MDEEKKNGLYGVPVRCGRCGREMVPYDCMGMGIIYYRCPDIECRMRIPGDELENALFDYMEALGAPQVCERLQAAFQQHAEREQRRKIDELSRKIMEAERTLEQLRRQRRELEERQAQAPDVSEYFKALHEAKTREEMEPIAAQYVSVLRVHEKNMEMHSTLDTWAASKTASAGGFEPRERPRIGKLRRTMNIQEAARRARAYGGGMYRLEWLETYETGCFIKPTNTPACCMVIAGDEHRPNWSPQLRDLIADDWVDCYLDEEKTASAGGFEGQRKSAPGAREGNIHD